MHVSGNSKVAMREHPTEAEGRHAWFQREIERAIREANDPTTPRIAHDLVKLNWQERRAALAKRIAAEMDGPKKSGHPDYN